MEALEKPFTCTECESSFTNEDRLSVHLKKHDMVLQLEVKGAYVADQTPTPTRFIRNCEEVGLFQDLQNVNPFDETFKRAMESRSGSNNIIVDSNLSIDDTLHTPHIFPLLSDNNSNYSTKSDDKNNSNNTINRSRPPPRLKLMRQDSIDLDGNDDSIRLSTPIIGSDQMSPLNMKVVNNDNRKCDNNALSNIQIPIIAITDSSRDDINILNKSNDKQLMEQDVEIKNPELLTLPMNNFDNSTKLFSQKSIDLALDNFQNEANEKTVDLNNISIDELPHLDEINHDTSTAITIDNDIEEKSINSNMNIMLQNDNFNAMKTNCNEVPRSLSMFQTIQISPSVVDTTNIDDNNEKQKDEKGYELLLKWPDGKKVYLKEVFREGSEDNGEKEQLVIEAKGDVKQKLKKVIQKKRPATETVSENVEIISPVGKNVTKIMNRKNYLVPKFHPISTSTNGFVVSQINRPKDVNIISNVNKPKSIYLPVNMSTMPLTINTNPIKGTKVPIPKLNNEINIMQVAEKPEINKIIKPIIVAKVDSNKIAKISVNKSNKIPLKKKSHGEAEEKIRASSNETEENKKERNKAAVNRYRNRKKMMNEMLTNKNNILEMENRNLRLELLEAKNEIKRLLEIHKNCSI